MTRYEQRDAELRRYARMRMTAAMPPDLVRAIVADVDRTAQRGQGRLWFAVGGLATAAAAAVLVLAALGALRGDRIANPPVAPSVTAPATAEPAATPCASASSQASLAPAGQEAPAPSPYPAGRSGHFTLASAGLVIEYTVPSGLNLTAESRDAATGFAVGVSGLSYGFVTNEANTDSSFVPGSRGIVVADVTQGTWHDGVSEIPVGAGALLEELMAETGATGKISEAEVSGYPALAARLPGFPGSGYFHIHTSAALRGGTVDFPHPSFLAVVTVEQTVLLVQAWAETDDELDVWMPLATEFIDGLTIRRARNAGPAGCR